MTKYRADIDGLRAVAVLSVVLYHLDARLLRGGFVGVDVFFVISGFLITGVILDAEARGRFSFVDFYSRRVRRIFPSLLLVFAFALVLGWFALFVEEYKNLGREIFYGAVFSSNLHLLRRSGYFDQASEFKPLLHLWSLGVEEQFYLVWPALLMSLRGRGRLPAVAALCAASFLANALLLGRWPDAVFYLPFTRFWELAVGCLLALRPREARPASRFVRDACAFAGFALILAAVFLCGRGTPFPGWRALLPTVGACLLIAAGEEAWLNRRILSHPLAVFFGLISYPLYLWHWPLLYFARVVESGAPSWTLKAAAAAAAAILAWLSYRFVELPIRRSAEAGPRWALGLFLANAAFAGIAYGVVKTERLRPEVGSLRRGAGLNEYTVRSCANTPDAYWCLSDKRETPVYALLGDSHAEALFPGLVRASRRGHRWLFLGSPGCAPLLGAGAQDASCAAFVREAARALGSDRRVKLVLIAVASRLLSEGSAPFLEDESARTGLAPDVVLRGMTELIRPLQASGKTVAVMIDNPAITSHPELCFPRKLWITVRTGPRCAMTRGDLERTTREYRALVGRLKAALPGLLVFDPTDVLCDRARCAVLNDGLSYYSYSDHLSDAANEKVAEAFWARLPPALRR